MIRFYFFFWSFTPQRATATMRNADLKRAEGACKQHLDGDIRQTAQNGGPPKSSKSWTTMTSSWNPFFDSGVCLKKRWPWSLRVTPWVLLEVCRRIQDFRLQPRRRWRSRPHWVPSGNRWWVYFMENPVNQNGWELGVAPWIGTPPYHSRIGCWSTLINCWVLGVPFGSPGGFVYREWLPNAKQVFLIGEWPGDTWWFVGQVQMLNHSVYASVS